MMKNLNLIGPQVRKLRSQHEWTQEELAAKLQRVGFDVSRSRLAKIEARMVCIADHEILFFMKVFHVRFRDLLPPIDPEDPELYDKLDDWMNRRF